MSGNDSVSEKTVGTIKWFNVSKGYGFIKLADGPDVFIHANQLRKSGIERSLAEGEKVSFSVSSGNKGSYAVDITAVPNSKE